MKKILLLIALAMLVFQFIKIENVIQTLSFPYQNISNIKIEHKKYWVLGTSQSRKAIVLEQMPNMYSTFTCESGYRHYDYKGHVLKSNINFDGSYDYGWTQINDSHEPEARKLGFNLKTMSPEQAYILTKIIYKNEGPHAWTCYKK